MHNYGLQTPWIRMRCRVTRSKLFDTQITFSPTLGNIEALEWSWPSRASNLKVRGSTLGLNEIFVRCFSVSPTHMEFVKKGKTLSVMLEVNLVVNSLL